jgi:hypothetical protein
VRLATDRALLETLATGGKPLIAKHSVDGMVDHYLSHYGELERGVRVKLEPHLNA